MKNKKAENLLNKLAEQENSFLEQRFFAPCLQGRPIRVKIAGIIQQLRVTRPRNYQGWGVFQPTSYKECRKVRDANLSEKETYFNLFPRLRMILCRREETQWQSVMASQSDTRYKITGMVPVQLVDECQIFDVIRVRFDGATFWYESPELGRDLRTTIYLRESLTQLVEPDKLDASGLTQGERDAYLLAYGPALEADIEARKDKNEERIKAALAHAGALYRGYIERGNSYTIEYTVGNETHKSTVNKDTLSVEAAGICLSGGDRNFDLQSLVGVIKEGQNRHRIVRVGLNREYGDANYYDRDNEDDYD